MERPGLPRDAWLFKNVEEYKEPCTCDMCGFVDKHPCYYLYLMKHPTHADTRVCRGCVDCMMHNLQSWMAREWYLNKEGKNPHIWIEGFRVTVFRRGTGWSACAVEDHGSCGGIQDDTRVFMASTHATEEGAKRAAFPFWEKVQGEAIRRWEKEAAESEAKWQADVAKSKKWIQSYLADGAKPDTYDKGQDALGVERAAIVEAAKQLGMVNVEVKKGTKWDYADCLPSNVAPYRAASKRVRQEIAKWLPGFLADGPRLVLAAHVTGGKRGWSSRMIRDAAKIVGVKVLEGDEAKAAGLDGFFRWWRLPV
jgi:hypothetical protein